VKVVDWINLALDRDQRRALVNAIMHVRILHWTHGIYVT
jgi:hypothetical protein